MRGVADARFDEATFYLDDPHATYRRLRVEDPVHWYEEGQFWVLTKYEDIKHVSSHPADFSSVQIAIMSDLVHRRAGIEPPREGERGIMFMDPPKHAEHRKVVSSRFTPKTMVALEGHVRDVVREVLDGIPEGEFDWIKHVAEPVPVFVFSQMLGAPRDDWHQIVEWATTIANAGAGQASEADMDVIFNEVGPYLWQLAVDRQDTPTDDLLTLITQGSVYGQPLDETQVISYALTLLAAGSETTQSLIAGLAACFSAHPDQAARVFDDPTLAGGAVEETLRWWTPVMSMARQATRDVELRGVTIREGDGVLLLYPSANRDEDRWGDDADSYLVSRSDASNQLGFGFGEHFCLGAALARMEGRIAFEEILKRWSRIELAGAVESLPSMLVRGIVRLPVAFSA